MRLFIALGLASLVVLASPAAPTQAAAASARAHQDWSKSFAVTPAGGFRIGNPNAKVALVEYGSLICTHCRHFAEGATRPLINDYVRTGRASYEFRPLILNAVDMAAFLVARCGGPSRFFPIAEQLYATQPDWTGRINQDQYEKLLAMPQGQMLATVARMTGLTKVSAQHGIPAPRAEACARSDAAVDRLVQITKGASDQGIQGTPTFLVNGQRVPAIDWPTLQPFLKSAGG